MSKKVRRPQAPKRSNKKWDKKQSEVYRERPIKNKIKKRQKYPPKEVDYDWD